MFSPFDSFNKAMNTYYQIKSAVQSTKMVADDIKSVVPQKTVDQPATEIESETAAVDSQENNSAVQTETLDNQAQ